ncbi:RipA family octameric membrane protein [Tenacibaculum amylolyticum]|uniref:RipA family octameric membrane protein n=1 Tax=Tenacibaculum amylolyticum TaxID=104269 RepID=UPI0038945400
MNNIAPDSKKLTRKERYQFLINARNFHYDNFNKWMTYFYVANGALFVGYYTIASNANMSTEKLILITLGYITSLFWYWSSKGYYFWNINFITLVNDCEKNTLKLKKKERVYSVFANKKTQNNYLNPISGANISTSKIAILFSFVISIVWSVLLLEKLKEMKLMEIHFLCEFIISTLVTLILSYFIPKYFLKSKIDHFHDLKINQIT